MRRYVTGLYCAVLGLAVVGCSSDAVQEDRTIAFGPAAATAFQHGSTGVFVDVDGESRRIFEPAGDVLAVGSPQWSPDRRYVLFTTATAMSPPPQTQVADAVSPVEPDGRLLLNQPIRYTCWRYDSKAETSQPAKLFEAKCGHAGYVGAKLAVRWARDGASVLFVDTDAQGRHRLKRFGVQARATTDAFPHAVEWLVFEPVPESDAIVVCVEGKRNNGVWIGGAKEWWHVADVRGANRLSTRTGSLQRLIPFMANTSDSPLERLRGLLPTWTNDGSRFAFISRDDVLRNEKQPSLETFGLHAGVLAKQSVEVVVESDRRMSDVRWHPSGSKLGFVRYGEDGFRADVVATSLDGRDSEVLAEDVRQFAGWNAAGDGLAVVVPETQSSADRDNWAFLMLRGTLGRESLRVEGRDQANVFSGTRITFPNWSPDGTKLSFWATFTPRHRSLMSFLRPEASHGDPAATIDLKSGELHWMPVSGLEKLFVGNYYLLQQQTVLALKWYDEADLPKPTPSNRRHLALAHLYRAIALRSLGRKEDADLSDQKFVAAAQELFGEPIDSDRPARELTQAEQRRQGEAVAIQRELLRVEAYASVDRLDECKQSLRQGRANEPSVNGLARQIALGQVLLLQGDKSGFVDLVSERLLEQSVAQVANRSVSLATVSLGEPMIMSVQLSFLPLMCESFYEDIPGTQARSLAARIAAVRKGHDDSGSAIDENVERALAHIRSVAAESSLDTKTDIASKSDVGFDVAQIRDAARILRTFPDSLLVDHTE